MSLVTIAAIAVACISGALLSVQIAANRKLGASLGGDFGDMLWSAATSFTIGLVALLACCLALGKPLHAAAATERAPWWAWTGGLMGAFYVAATIVLLPRLGALALVGLVVGGQVLASLCIDHFGLLGVEQHPLSVMRLAGAALLVVGVAMALKG
jgi:transporter family-2 protein